jgi:hypothetical protein
MKSILRRMELRWAMYLQDLVRRSLLPVFQRELDRNVRRDWTAAMLASSNPLFRAGAKYYSQFDEDGILLEILRRLKLERGRFVEIGVGDGMENNTIILLVHGWTGLWLGNQTLAWSPTGTRLRFQQTMVSPDNVAGLVGDDPIDVLGLDVDGNDYWILKALLARSQPRVLVLEYNGKFPPPVRFVMPFDASHGWSGGDYFGLECLLHPSGRRARLRGCHPGLDAVVSALAVPGAVRGRASGVAQDAGSDRARPFLKQKDDGVRPYRRRAGPAHRRSDRPGRRGPPC